jgi:hypothetical protein
MMELADSARPKKNTLREAAEPALAEASGFNTATETVP